MLAVTEAAADAITALTARDGISEQGGLRLAMPATGESADKLALSLALAPAEGDQVVTGVGGAKVFMDPQARDFLSDKILDVRVDTEGQLSFTLRPQD
ncbi:iron-sulfur cluster biosynthesis protein [Actinophytocola sp.]|uniref:iron-sulfur cluster biosynthesis protein n=1 Tax=Actinophytocola sp. TaxID=1872138 RepID=UPI002D7E8713|nr:iron-sulfur cluster biosynthesis protein [Actinophytocola sp.]HET9142693.1 iron-sulfur cluster biosynthesis protein [Actinophytocola sp.]